MVATGDRGLDVAWGEPQSWQHVFDLGYRFVFFYLSFDPSKNLDPEDRDACLGAGIAIGEVWETTAARALAGWQAGFDDAVEANKQADALGTPDYVAIYFATDVDTSADAVRAYYQGAKAGSRRAIGAYGSIHVVDPLMADGTVPYTWQTVAWSGGQLSPTANVYQRAIRTLPDPGGNTDEDVALKPVQGLWLPGPPPAPVVVKPPPPPLPFTFAQENTSMSAHFGPDGQWHQATINPDGSVLYAWDVDINRLMAGGSPDHIGLGIGPGGPAKAIVFMGWTSFKADGTPDLEHYRIAIHASDDKIWSKDWSKANSWTAWLGPGVVLKAPPAGPPGPIGPAAVAYDDTLLKASIQRAVDLVKLAGQQLTQL